MEGGVWHNLGKLRFDFGDFLGATEAYTHAIEKGYTASYVNRGLCFEQLDDTQAAYSDYMAALEQDPDDVKALIDLGTLELENGDVDGARLHLTAAAGIDPRANWQLADVLIRASDRHGARELLSKAIAAGELRAYLELAELADTEGDPRAEEYFRHAVSSGARDARREYVIFLDENGRVEEAIAQALEGVALGETRCNAPLAVIYESQGEVELAKEYYRRAILDGESYYQPDLDALTRDG